MMKELIQERLNFEMKTSISISFPVRGRVRGLVRDNEFGTALVNMPVYSKDREKIGEVSGVTLWEGDEFVDIHFHEVPIEVRRWLRGIRISKKGFPLTVSRKGWLGCIKKK